MAMRINGARRRLVTRLRRIGMERNVTRRHRHAALLLFIVMAREGGPSSNLPPLRRLLGPPLSRRTTGGQTLSSASDTPWPTPTHIVASARLPPRFSSPCAAVRIDVRGVIGDAELAQAGETLRGKGFVDLDQIEIGNLEAEPLHQLFGRWHGADSHDARRYCRRGHAEDAGTRRQSVRLGSVFACKNDGGGAVVDAGGIAGGDGAGIANDGL